MTGTYTRLRNKDGTPSDTWGARIFGDAVPGGAVTITTKKGAEHPRTVDRIRWKGNDQNTGDVVSIVTLQPDRAGAPAQPNREPDVTREDFLQALGQIGDLERRVAALEQSRRHADNDEDQDEVPF